MEYYTIPLKTCTKCKRVKPATRSFFYKNSKSKDGLLTYCIQCRRKQIDEYVANNPDKVKHTQQQYREKHREERRLQSAKYYSENRERYNKTQRLYYRKNKDKIDEQNRLWAIANPHKTRAIKSRWQRKNKEAGRVKTSRHRARKRSMPNTLTTQEWEYCLEYFNYTCPVCDSQLRDLFGNVEPHADHWIPLSHEDCPGTIATNMVCLCNYCNTSKGGKLPQDWLTEKYGKRKAAEILARIEAYFKSIC